MNPTPAPATGAPNKLRPGAGRFRKGDRVRIAASVSVRDGPDQLDEKRLRQVEPDRVVNVKDLRGRVVADPYVNEQGVLCHAVQEEGSGAMVGVPERALRSAPEQKNAPWRESVWSALSPWGKRNWEKVFKKPRARKPAHTKRSRRGVRPGRKRA